MAWREPNHPPAVSIDKHGTPADLMGSGHHFHDEPGGTGRRPVARGATRQETPMRAMMRQVADLDLRRPNIE